MKGITVSRPDKKNIEETGVLDWPIWEKEVSSFDWEYDSEETCFIIEGKARVVPEQGESVEFSAGDMVIFPAGMKCVWNVISPIKKHYKFG